LVGRGRAFHFIKIPAKNRQTRFAGAGWMGLEKRVSWGRILSGFSEGAGELEARGERGNFDRSADQEWRMRWASR
jgi:hypothetical protein